MTDNGLRAAWPWVLGVAILGVVVVMGLRRSEGAEFLALARQAEPSWFVLAVIIQVLTYIVQAEVWLIVMRGARVGLSRWAAFELSVAKLFVDQALPSAGISSTIMLVSSLERRRVPQPVSLAAAAVNLTSYHAGYTIAIIAATVVAAANGWMNAIATWLTLMSIVFLGLVTMGLLLFAGRRPRGRLALLERVPLLGRGLIVVEKADRMLVMKPALLGISVAAQLGIVALDTLTLMALVLSLGAHTSLAAAFVAVMVGSLFRTIGIVPSGLGTFEAGVVVALHASGLTVPIALSATLLFRGLSFWLPMLPGWWCARRVVAIRSFAPIAPPRE